MTERKAISALLAGEKIPDDPGIRPVLAALEAAGSGIERHGGMARLARPPEEKTRENPVLVRLLESPGEWFSAKVLARELGISTYRVEKLIRDIREEGIALERKRGKGLRLANVENEDKGEDRHGGKGKPKAAGPVSPPRPKPRPAPAGSGPTARRRAGRRLARALGMALGFFLILALAGGAWFGMAWIEAWRDGRLEVNETATAETARPADKVAANLEKLLFSIRQRSREMDRRLAEVERRLAERDKKPPRQDAAGARQVK